MIWVFTRKGAAWFDGFKWQPIEIDGTPTLERIESIAVDTKDRIVFITGGRLYRGD